MNCILFPGQNFSTGHMHLWCNVDKTRSNLQGDSQEVKYTKHYIRKYTYYMLKDGTHTGLASTLLKEPYIKGKSTNFTQQDHFTSHKECNVACENSCVMSSADTSKWMKSDVTEVILVWALNCLLTELKDHHGNTVLRKETRKGGRKNKRKKRGRKE